MSLRDPFTDSIDDPPPGQVRVAFWRHTTAGSSDPSISVMHRERARLIHELVDEAQLEVADWGNVDAPHPSEVVQMLIEGLVGVGLGKLVDFLWAKLKNRQPGTEQTLKAVTLRRPDGHELVWHFQAEVSAETAASEIERFLKQLPVERLMGKRSAGAV